MKEDCYSAVLQCVAINLNKAFTNFFQVRARFPKFKSKHGKQSIQYPQNVVIKGSFLSVPKIGDIIAVFHRELLGRLKTVTISKVSSGKYLASLLYEAESESRACEGKILGVDLGVKDLAIVHDGETVSKYANPKHLKRHERNRARKQKKLERKTKGSKGRTKFRRIVAKVYERVSNARQDFLHKLSRKLVDESQVIVGENLNVKGMVLNRKLSKAISDVGWGTFVNFLVYKLERKAGKLIEIDRFFPSSKMCSCCGCVVEKLPLDVREWSCPSCGSHHDRDGNAALNIRNEGIRILNIGGGNPVSASGACVRPDSREVKGLQAVNLESHHTDSRLAVWVVHTWTLMP